MLHACTYKSFRIYSNTSNNETGVWSPDTYVWVSLGHNSLVHMIAAISKHHCQIFTLFIFTPERKQQKQKSNFTIRQCTWNPSIKLYCPCLPEIIHVFFYWCENYAARQGQYTHSYYQDRLWYSSNVWGGGSFQRSPSFASVTQMNNSWLCHQLFLTNSRILSGHTWNTSNGRQCNLDCKGVIYHNLRCAQTFKITFYCSWAGWSMLAEDHTQSLQEN
jgi:hypothetical protein